MNLRQVFGVILIAFGAYILVRGLSFTTKEKVIDLGSVEASADKQHTIPPWGGAVIGGVGILLVAAGGTRRRD
jgi:hypothetical protein